MFENLHMPQNISAALNSAVKENKLSHAYFFYGKDEQLITQAANEFAKACVCKNSFVPCNVCSSCKKAQHGTHPDIISLFPEGASIKINQIKQLKYNINLLPFESEKKVYIINHADTMQKPAQNSLLKTLEEPNKYAIIILLANSKNAFYPTILSRCQIFYFGDLKANEHIKEIVYTTFIYMLQNNFEQIMENSLLLAEEQLTDVFMVIVSILRDSIVYKLSKNTDNIVNKDNIDLIKKVSGNYELAKLKKTVDYIYDIRTNASTNNKLMIESIFCFLSI
jgi:DNA polymerase-3 subunit delta'